MNEEIQKHSVHTLIFRSLKRSHDFFLQDRDNPVEFDEKALDIRRKVRCRDDYGTVMCLVKHDKVPNHQSVHSSTANDDRVLLNVPYMNGVSEKNLEDGRIQESQGLHNSAAGVDSNSPIGTNESVGQNALVSRLNQQDSVGGSRELSLPHQQTIVVKKSVGIPKPKWHRPWKLYRVISGHLGWVRCVDVEPNNQWFVTGAADRIIKIWDLATGALKLSLTGHVSTVRGVVVSDRQPYLFSGGEDKQVKCWDLEVNKVVRHYHGHLSAVYALSLHPTLDILVSCGRDSVARVWDMRTKAQIHCLTGHTSTVADVKCQPTEPQIITGSHDCTIKLWDIVAGRTMCTLTHHKKSVRSIVLHPRLYQMASASPDNIKQWKFPNGEFIQNLSGHNVIVNSLALNSDNVLVSGGDNGSMYLWDWKTGYNFQRLQSKPQPGSIDPEMGVFALCFDQSGSRLISCESDKTVKLYKEDMTALEEDYPIDWRPDIFKRKRF